MDELSLNSEKLAKYRNDADIVHKTALQVIKDFAQFGFEINFPGNINFAYQDLLTQLIPTINNLLKTDLSKFYSLLYYIDLNENSIKKCLKEMENVPFDEAITHLLLERELKKVITREFFKRAGL